MSKKLQLLDETEFINDTNKGVTSLIKTYKFGEDKFQIRYENSNGSPLGFNSKMCLRQYSREKAQWNNLEDIRVLKMNQGIPSYYSQSCKTHCLEFFQKMEDRIIRVYS